MGLRFHVYKNFFPEAIAAKAIRHISTVSGIVLMYHEVLPDEIGLPAWTVVRESDFRWQMEFLRTHFDILDIDQGLCRIDGKYYKNKRPFAVVTFDDGYKGGLTTVLPIMEEMGIPFTIYISTKAIITRGLNWFDKIINLLHVREKLKINFISNDQFDYFSIPSHGEYRRWREIQKLLERLKLIESDEREKIVKNIIDGVGEIGHPLELLNEKDLQRLSISNCVTIGCHTHGHELLDQIGLKEVEETIFLANKHINRVTGVYPCHFSFPNGNFNEDVVKVVRQANFVTAVTTIPGFWTEMTNKMKIPRIGIGRFDAKNLFKAKVSGYLK